MWMVQQLGCSDLDLRKGKHITRKEKFLAKMEVMIPWCNLEAQIEPYYPKAGIGRRPYPLSSMLPVHCLQQWYSLNDPATEDSLYEIVSMRRFTKLSLDKSIPDHTTVMKFRYLLEKHYLGRQVFEAISQWLEESGVLVKEGSSIDATIIEAPSSTKNKLKHRDPDMHQTKKGNQWHFGMKAHIGVDVKSELTHTSTTTPANEHVFNQAHNLLHGEEEYVFLTLVTVA